jgi:steroid delta-isomerase-like uncharacterized protein
MNEPESTSERIARLYFIVFNDRELDALDQLLAPEFVSHLRVGDVRGIDSFRQVMVDFYRAFPDVHWIVDEWVFTEERVVVRYHWQGTQTEPWLGIPPTHKLVRGEGLELLHIADGRITEVWNYSDIMGLAAQLQAPGPLDIEI